MKRLSRARVVRSQRGSRGGYSLSRPAEEISILEVIDALEGPWAVTECSSVEVDTSCVNSGSCNVQDNWKRINDAIRAALGEITLADMAKPMSANLVQLARSRAEAIQLRAPGVIES